MISASFLVLVNNTHIKCFIYWTADLKSSKPRSSQLWTQIKQLRVEAWKSQDLNRVWTRDLAIPVRRSNQLSYPLLLSCSFLLCPSLYICSSDVFHIRYVPRSLSSSISSMSSFFSLMLDLNYHLGLLPGKFVTQCLLEKVKQRCFLSFLG